MWLQLLNMNIWKSRISKYLKKRTATAAILCKMYQDAENLWTRWPMANLLLSSWWAGITNPKFFLLPILRKFKMESKFHDNAMKGKILVSNFQNRRKYFSVCSACALYTYKVSPSITCTRSPITTTSRDELTNWIKSQSGNEAHLVAKAINKKWGFST